jgi:hypothetical protein
MKFIKALVVILTLCLPNVANAAWASFQAANNTAAPVTGFVDLPRGAGGFNQGMSIAADGTLVLRTDTYGDYIWNPTGNPPVGAAGSGTWNQLITSSSMPADYVNMSPGLAGHGVYEIQICYSNSQIMYMTTVDVEAGDLTGSGGGNSTVFKTTNRSTNWIRTAFTPVSQTYAQANQGTYKEFGPKIAIDSSNCNHVYAGTAGLNIATAAYNNSTGVVTLTFATAPSIVTGQTVSVVSIINNANGNPVTQLQGNFTATVSGTTLTYTGTSGLGVTLANTGFINNGILYLSTDGNTFNPVSGSTIPTPIGTAGYTAMQIARYNPSIIYIGSSGNGIYQSTNGDTGPFTHLTAGTGPTNTNLTNSAIDEAAGSFQGTFYVIDEINNLLWSWNGSTWAQIQSGVHSFAVDPQLSGHLIAIGAGGGAVNNTLESFNAGSTWITTTHQTIAGDIGWIANFTGSVGTSPWAFFDRSNNKLVWQLSSVGPYQITWTGNIATTTTPTYSITGRGVEQVVGIDVIAPPAAGSGGLACPVIPAGWDFEATCSPNFTTYPTTYYPNYPTFAAIWSTDIATSDSSNRIVSLADGVYGGGSQQSAYSDNGGTIWTSIVSNLPASEQFGGSLAASTSANWCFNTTNVRQPYCTANGGGSWTPISISGVTLTGSNIGCPYNIPCRYIVADRVNQNQFTLMIGSAPNAGFYETMNGGTTWSSLGNNNNVANGNGQMRTIPGQANHIWLASGNNQTGIGAITTTTGLSYTSNAGSTWTLVTNMGQCYSVGFGKAEVSYPDIYVAGWLKLPSTTSVASGTGTKMITITGSPGHTILAGAPVLIDSPGNNWDLSGSVTSYIGGVLTASVTTVLQGSGNESTINVYVWGEYKTTGGQTASPIWVQLDGLPGGSLDLVQGISGDMNIAGRAYMAFGGSGFKKINWLLERDIDPASNDNNPVGLEKAA